MPLLLVSMPVASQNRTSTLPTVLAERRVAAKVRHSVWHAVVILSPFQQVGMRVPADVQPGHLPLTVQYLIGHSKTLWKRPGNVEEIAQGQLRPGGGAARPKLSPQINCDKGFAVNGCPNDVPGRGGAGGWPACACG